MCAARARELYEKRARERMNEGQKSGGRGNKKNSVEPSPQSLDAGKARDEAGKVFGVSGKSVAVGKALQAERDENTCRKEFALSEAVAVGRDLNKLEGPKAKDRKSQAPGEPRGKRKVSTEKFSTESGRALDKVGEGIGLSRITYARARDVVDGLAGLMDQGLVRHGRNLGVLKSDTSVQFRPANSVQCFRRGQARWPMVHAFFAPVCPRLLPASSPAGSGDKSEIFLLVPTS
jgi:hypothetical protein